TTNEVHPVDVVHEGGVQYHAMRDVEVTPDDTWIVLSAGGLVAVVNANTFELSNHVLLEGKNVNYLTIQNSP
ncbi:MAG: hypothetical protein OEV80_06275, partial [candidate division Zixibacteria bacterium]|nr:hypothetical protein [candidate division Zixibacteria bacterium]